MLSADGIEVGTGVVDSTIGCVGVSVKRNGQCVARLPGCSYLITAWFRWPNGDSSSLMNMDIGVAERESQLVRVSLLCVLSVADDRVGEQRERQPHTELPPTLARVEVLVEQLRFVCSNGHR